MTLLNGQTGALSTPGFRMTARPVVSADRKFVQVALNIEQSEPATCPQGKVATMTLDKVLNIPDGGTVLCSGLKRVVETRTECGPPVVNRIPYVNRLFRSVGYGRESQTMVVMVTPRIIISEEEETKATATPASEKVAPEPAGRQEKVVAELLRAYQAACAEGKSDEARKYARAALAIDPTCFRKNP
jgi:type II secretory pathway component GspD/PulD (secretin)